MTGPVEGVPAEAVEAVARVIALAEGVTPNTDPWHDETASRVLRVIRDALHRDGADADAIREALGLPALIAKAKADSLREAADAIHGDPAVYAKHLSGGFVRGLRSATRLTSLWLRRRADRIEAES